MDHSDTTPDEPVLPRIPPLRRVAAFNAELLRSLCDCHECWLCNFISLEPPPVAGLRFGNNTPEDE